MNDPPKISLLARIKLYFKQKQLKNKIMSEVKDAVKNLTSFGKEVVARIKGDDAEALAQANERKGRSAYKGQVSSLESRIVDLEDKVTEATEALAVAKYPTTKITDSQSYINNVRRAKEALTAAEEELEQTKESLEFYQGILDNEF